MADGSRSMAHRVVACSFLLLALAVFAWGLHAKLSLYHPHEAPSTNTVAKLLTGQRSGRALVPMPEVSRPRTPWQVAYTVFAALLLLLTRQVWRTQREPQRTPARAPLPRARFISRPPPTRFRAR